MATTTTSAPVTDVPAPYRIVPVLVTSPKTPAVEIPVGVSMSSSGDMTDKESRALVRGMLLADRKRSGPGWGATIMIAILAVPAVMVALGFLLAWKDDRLGEVLSLEPAGYYESVDRTTCKDIVAIGGTCRSPLPRK